MLSHLPIIHDNKTQSGVKAELLLFLKTCATIKRNTTEEHLVCHQCDDEIELTATDNTRVSRTTSVVVNDKILEGLVHANLLK